MKTKRLRTLVLPIVVVLFVLIYPYEQTVVSAANIVVFDETGKLLPNVVVKQEWTDGTVEATQHVDLTKSDETGHVAFPRRTKRAPLGLRIINTAWRVLTQGVHASVGSSGAITVYSNGDPYVWAWTGYRRNGGRWPDQMRLERTATAIYP